jgi:hypothetical protein
VSPRRNYPKKRQKPEEPREINIASTGESVEEHSDGVYIVRRLTGSGSTKPYRCPGCDQMIPLATPHVVAWKDYDEDGRRHWHTACWAKKDKASPKYRTYSKRAAFLINLTLELNLNVPLIPLML